MEKYFDAAWFLLKSLPISRQRSLCKAVTSAAYSFFEAVTHFKGPILVTCTSIISPHWVNVATGDKC